MSGLPMEVLGEDVPRDVATALAGFGLSCALGAAVLIGTELSRPESLPVPVPLRQMPREAQPPAADKNAPPPAVDVAPAAASASATASDCAPLVVEFPSSAVHVGHDTQQALTQLGHWIAEHRQVRATVDGHADALGGTEANMQLSRLRATTVAALLSQGGAEQTQLRVRWFGAFVPVDGTPEDGAQNRRVVVRIDGALCPRLLEKGSMP
jgi:outer membrane protein OmpA-like peptidoglycan-associated protein